MDTENVSIGKNTLAVLCMAVQGWLEDHVGENGFATVQMALAIAASKITIVKKGS